LCYFAAVYSKEHSVAAPGLALALTLLLRPPSRETWRLVAPFFLFSVVVPIAVILQMKGVIATSYESNASGMLARGAMLQGLNEVPNAHLLSIISQSLLFFKYLALWVLPNPAWMSADMREPLALSVFAWPHTAGLAGFLLYVATALYLLCRRGRRGLCGFAMLFPAVLFVTEFSTVRIQEAFVLYRSYLWMPGLFLLLPLLLGRVPGRWAFVALTLLALAFVPLTLNRIQSFSSPYALWDDAEKLVRGKQGVFGMERTYFNLGTELGTLGRYEEAAAAFSQAIKIYPYYDFIYGNRATAYFFLKKYDEALADYNRAIELNPDNEKSYYGRAIVYQNIGNWPAAQADFAKSCSLGLCP
ncbi:MAG: tetratricopeptide repeat protein, partial [Pseudomonadota bacterium]